MNNDLISREALKKVINYNQMYVNPKLAVDNVIKLIDNAPTVDTTFREVVAYECGQKSVERQHGEWISVSKKLPEDMQDVLIWFEYYRYGDFNCMYQTYGFGYVCDGKWSSFINGHTGWHKYRVIAWMPLPKPYKESENE